MNQNPRQEMTSDQEPPSTDDAFSSPIERPRVDGDNAMSVTDFRHVSLDNFDTGLWVSCSVTVEGFERNLFVLLRETS